MELSLWTPKVTWMISKSTRHHLLFGFEKQSPTITDREYKMTCSGKSGGQICQAEAGERRGSPCIYSSNLEATFKKQRGCTSMCYLLSLLGGGRPAAKESTMHVLFDLIIASVKIAADPFWHRNTQSIRRGGRGWRRRKYCSQCPGSQVTLWFVASSISLVEAWNWRGYGHRNGESCSQRSWEAQCSESWNSRL